MIKEWKLFQKTTVPASVAYRFSLYLHVDLHEVLIQKTTIYSFR